MEYTVNKNLEQRPYRRVSRIKVYRPDTNGLPYSEDKVNTIKSICFRELKKAITKQLEFEKELKTKQLEFEKELKTLTKELTRVQTLWDAEKEKKEIRLRGLFLFSGKFKAGNETVFGDRESEENY